MKISDHSQRIPVKLQRQSQAQSVRDEITRACLFPAPELLAFRNHQCSLDHMWYFVFLSKKKISIADADSPLPILRYSKLRQTVSALVLGSFSPHR